MGFETILDTAVVAGETTLSTSVTNLVGYLNSAVDFLTGNEVTLLFLAGAVIALGMKLFKKARRAVS